MFYMLSITLAIIVGFAIFWPLLKQGQQARNYGMAAVFFLPIAALLLYQQVGSPLGIGVSGSPQNQAAHPGNVASSMTDVVALLEQRLQENPADLEGWILLGRSYKTMQQYEQAETALLRAIQMAPDDPLVLAELAEARLFTSGDPRVSAESRELLERALRLDPEQQKALWLLGIAARQDGEDAAAVQYWQRLVAVIDPASPVAQSVQEQIDLARMRMGMGTPAPVATALVNSEGIRVEISLDRENSALPEQAVLFLIVRDPKAPVPPLGAKRIANPNFPLSLVVTDADSMMAARPISGTDPVQIVARISLSGSPVAAEGDLESPPLEVSAASEGPFKLQIPIAGG